jgi:endonuclease/exonuclease/phosphatase family metal-dependent hydrolase
MSSCPSSFDKNKSFCHIIPDVIPLVIGTYNINSGAVTDSSFSDRADAVFKMIISLNADVLCIQELRDQPGAPFLEFLARFASHGYGFVWVSRNPTPNAFTQAILYRRHKYYCMQQYTRWITHEGFPLYPEDNDPAGTAPVILGCLLAPTSGYGKETKIDMGRCFAVFNIHMALSEESKNLYASKLRAAIDTMLGMGPDNSAGIKPSCVFVAGDANTFFDREGEDQLRAIHFDSFDTICLESLTTDFKEMPPGSNAPYRYQHFSAMQDETGCPISGSFYGCEADPFKKDLDNPGMLDHIWHDPHLPAASPTKTVTAVVHRRLVDGKMVRDQPSDHCPVTINYNLLDPRA